MHHRNVLYMLVLGYNFNLASFQFVTTITQEHLRALAHTKPKPIDYLKLAAQKPESFRTLPLALSFKGVVAEINTPFEMEHDTLIYNGSTSTKRDTLLGWFLQKFCDVKLIQAGSMYPNLNFKIENEELHINAPFQEGLDHLKSCISYCIDSNANPALVVGGQKRIDALIAVFPELKEILHIPQSNEKDILNKEAYEKQTVEISELKK